MPEDRQPHFEVRTADPLVFAAIGEDGNWMRPNGLIHALPEPDVGEHRSVTGLLDAVWRLPLLCGAERGEGCGPTRLSTLAAPSALDDGHVIGTAVTCPACLTILENL